MWKNKKKDCDETSLCTLHGWGRGGELFGDGCNIYDDDEFSISVDGRIRLESIPPNLGPKSPKKDAIASS